MTETAVEKPKRPRDSVLAERALAKQKEQDKQDEARLQLQQDYEDHVYGRDTPGAKRVRAELSRVAQKRRVGDLAGDPLRLKPEHRHIAASEEKARKAKKKKGIIESPADDVRETELYDDRYNRQKVMQRGFDLRGYDTHHINAAQKFARDWELANAGTLRGPDWNPKVDGGGGGVSHGAHIARVDAQGRMVDIKAALGAQQLDLIEAVIIYGVGIEELARAAVVDRKIVTSQLKAALGQLAAYYDGKPARKAPLYEAIERILAAKKREAEIGPRAS